MEPILERQNATLDLGGLCECFISYADGRRDVARLHIHHCFELLYCTEGGFELTVDQRSYALDKGCAALIHPMSAHSTRSLLEGRNSYLVLKFTPESLYFSGLHWQKYLYPYLHFDSRSVDLFPAGEELSSLLETILRERQQQGYGYEMALHAYISQVMVWFLRVWQQGKDNVVMDEQTLVRLQRTQDYVQAHLDDALSAQQAAAHLSMGLSTFSRFFTQAAGMSFPAYVKSQRLGRAVMMLAQTGKSVTEIAMETGFSSASYLVFCFRKQYGVTPSQFRKGSEGHEKEAVVSQKSQG